MYASLPTNPPACKVCPAQNVACSGVARCRQLLPRGNCGHFAITGDGFAFQQQDALGVDNANHNLKGIVKGLVHMSSAGMTHLVCSGLLAG